MKYGMRERISGAIIILALAVIFLPMLFDEPAPREEQPKPQMSLEKPIEVERQEVEPPKPPASVGSVTNPMPQQPSVVTPREESLAERQEVPQVREEPASPQTPPAGREVSSSASSNDPIAELAEQKQSSPEPAAQAATPAESKPAATSAQGNWSVQAGSFGQPDNAKRLEAKLKEQGFDAYRRQRDNNLTTVYVGPYASSEAGEKARGELKAKANIQGLLVRTDR